MEKMFWQYTFYCYNICLNSIILFFIVVIVQSLSGIWLFEIPWTAACQASWWCHPTTSSSAVPFSSCPQSFPASEPLLMSQLLEIRWPKYWSFSFSISSSKEYSGLISFMIDKFDLPAFQGTLKSLQHHRSKELVLQHSAFVMVQLSHPYMTTEKTIALTRWIFVSKVMSLLFHMLCVWQFFLQGASVF